MAADRNDVDVSRILEIKAQPRPLPEDTDIFPALRPETSTYAVSVDNESRRESVDDISNDYTVTGVANETSANGDLEFYELFLIKLQKKFGNGEFTRTEMDTAFQIKKGQLSEWLNRAVDDSCVIRETRPVRYRWQGSDPQITMFIE